MSDLNSSFLRLHSDNFFSIQCESPKSLHLFLELFDIKKLTTYVISLRSENFVVRVKIIINLGIP